MGVGQGGHCRLKGVQEVREVHRVYRTEQKEIVGLLVGRELGCCLPPHARWTEKGRVVS
jgi:hypothetical protein